MDTQELEQKLKQGNLKIRSKVTIYRKTDQGWSDAVDVSSFVTEYRKSEQKEFGADQINIDFINAHDLFWTNRDSPYNKSNKSNSILANMGNPSYDNTTFDSVTLEDGIRGYMISQISDGNYGSYYPPSGSMTYIVSKASNQRWNYLDMMAKHSGSLFSQIKVDLIFGATEEELETSGDRIENFLYSIHNSSSNTNAKIPKGFDPYNYCKIIVKFESPYAPHAEAVLQNIQMYLWSADTSSKYAPLVYWHNRIKIDEIVLFNDGTQAEFNKFYGRITEVPQEFSTSDRGSMQIKALDMMSILTSEIYERPSKNRRSVYQSNESLHNREILEPKKIYGNNGNTVRLEKLTTSNELIPLNDSDVGYVFAVPNEFRDNATCTNMGRSTQQDYQSVSRLFESNSETIISHAGVGTTTHHIPSWWKNGNISLSISPPVYGELSPNNDGVNWNTDVAWTVMINDLIIDHTQIRPSIVPYPEDQVFTISMSYDEDWLKNQWHYNNGSVSISTTATPPSMGGDIPVSDIVFTPINIPTDATSVKLGLLRTVSTTTQPNISENVAIEGTSSISGETFGVNHGSVRFKLDSEDSGKTVLVSLNNILATNVEETFVANWQLYYEFIVDSPEPVAGQGDKKYVNWVKLPQPVIKARHKGESDFRNFTEADGVQIDYARGIVYMPERYNDPEDRVEADFWWYDMDTNRFEEVVADIIKDAFLQVEGYSPNDWVLYKIENEEIKETTIEDEYAPNIDKAYEPLRWVYAPNYTKGKNLKDYATNLRIELRKSLPRATIPRTLFSLEDKKTHFQAIQELLDQRYVNPSYRIFVDTRTIKYADGEEDTEIVFKGDYQYQLQSDYHAEVVLTKNIRYPLDSKDLYTKVVGFGVRPSVPNVASDYKSLVFRDFLQRLSSQHEFYPERNSNTAHIRRLVDGDIRSSGNYIGLWCDKADYEHVLPEEAIRIELRQPIRLGRIDILWGRSPGGSRGMSKNGDNVSGFGCRIEVSENGETWYTLKEDGSSDEGSSGQWTVVSEEQFDPAIKLLDIKYIRIIATDMASYSTLSQGEDYCWSVREIQIFPSDEVRVEVSVDDLVSSQGTNIEESTISQELVDELRTLIGDRTYVLPSRINLMNEQMVQSRAKDVLFEMCRLLRRAEVDCIYLPHIKVGMTVRLNDTRTGTDRLYLIEGIESGLESTDKGVVPNCSLTLVSWE